MTRTQLVAAVTGTALCAGLALRLGFSPAHADARAHVARPVLVPSAVSAPATLTQPTAQASAYVPGAVRSYALDLKIDTGLGSGAAGSGATPSPTTEVRIVGSWQEVFVGGEGGAARFRIAFVEPKVSASGQVRNDSALRDELARPFFVERDVEGATHAIYFEHATGAFTRGLLKTALATRQVIVRAGQQWKSTEQDRGTPTVCSNGARRPGSRAPRGRERRASIRRHGIAPQEGTALDIHC